MSGEKAEVHNEPLNMTYEDLLKQKDSIIIKDLANGNEFYDVENLKKRFLKLIGNGKLKKEP